MTEDKQVKTRKPRPKYNPNNKEQGSKKKVKWRKKARHQKKDLGESLQELQSYINGKYHTS